VARKGSTRARLEAAAEELRWITNKAMDDAVRDVDTKTIARYVCTEVWDAAPAARPKAGSQERVAAVCL
jgi:hypothetical protein